MDAFKRLENYQAYELVSLYHLCLVKTVDQMHNVDVYYRRHKHLLDKEAVVGEDNTDDHNNNETNVILKPDQKTLSPSKALKRTYNKFINSYFPRRKIKATKSPNDADEEFGEDCDTQRAPCTATPTCEVEDRFRLSPNVIQDLCKLYQQRYALSDTLLKLCVLSSTNLTCLHLANARNINMECLEKMNKYRLQSLQITNMPNCSLNRTVSLLSKWSVLNLTDLTISKCRFSETNWICISVSLGKLRKLKVLNVSYTNFANDHLELAVEELPLLESINISNTLVTRIRPLTRLEHLRRLTLNNMDAKILDMSMLMSKNMRKLTHLSMVEDQYQSAELLQSDKLVRLFYGLLDFNRLIDLDVSGRRKITLEHIVDLLHARQRHAAEYRDYKQLKFLGLSCTSVNYNDAFYINSVLMCKTQLHCLGNMRQVCLALERDQSHGKIAHETIKYLYKMISEPEHSNYDTVYFELHTIGNRLLRAVIATYRHQLKSADVGITATACMHRILVADTMFGFHVLPHIFHEMFELLLDSLGHHRNNLILTMNTLLILYREGTKDRYTFNYSRCLQLLLAVLSQYEMVQVQSIIFPFSEFLRNKLTFKQMKQISACLCHVQALLKILKDYIRAPVEQRISASYIKVVLLMLWDFTDESPDVCGSFVLTGGIDVYLRLLHIGINTPELVGQFESKIFGVFCNIAEVQLLRKMLVKTSIINELMYHVESSTTSISFFAAGTLAHMAADLDGQGIWKNKYFGNRGRKPPLMCEVIERWGKDDMNLIYNSLRSFLRLLACEPFPGIQVYALWAIENVFTKNPAKYYPMLHEINRQMNTIPGLLLTNTIAVVESILARRITYYSSRITDALSNFLIARLIENHRDRSVELRCLCEKTPQAIRKEFAMFCKKYEKEDQIYERNTIAAYADQWERPPEYHLTIYSCWCRVQREDPFMYLSLSILSTFIANTATYQLGRYDIFTYLHHYMHQRYHQHKEVTTTNTSLTIII